MLGFLEASVAAKILNSAMPQSDGAQTLVCLGWFDVWKWLRIGSNSWCSFPFSPPLRSMTLSVITKAFCSLHAFCYVPTVYLPMVYPFFYYQRLGTYSAQCFPTCYINIVTPCYIMRHSWSTLLTKRIALSIIDPELFSISGNIATSCLSQPEACQTIIFPTNGRPDCDTRLWESKSSI